MVRWVDGKRSKYVVSFVVIPLLIIADPAAAAHLRGNAHRRPRNKPDR